MGYHKLRRMHVPIMKIPFISGEGPDGYLPVNLYFSPRKIYGRDALIGRPGLLEFCDLGSSAKVRAMAENRGIGFVVSGNGLYKVTPFGSSSLIGTLDHRTGNAWIESNGEQVCVVENNRCYIYEDETLSDVENDDLPFSPASLAYDGGYFLSHDANSENFYESDLYDGSSWNGVEYAITSVKKDYLSSLYAVNGQVYAMGHESGEVYYNSGGSDFAFSKIQGGNIPCGILAEKSGAVFLNSLVALDNTGVVVQLSANPIKLSNEHVDREIASMTTAKDANSFMFTMSGHTFYVITFPTGNKTFVYDMVFKHWYEWRTGTGRWRPNCYMKLDKNHLVGDYANGKIYELSETTYSDDGDEIIRQRAMPVQKGSELVTFSSFELEQEGGVGISTGQGSDPQAVLEVSVDKGKTWGNEKWRDIGKAGKYKQRLIWRRLGRHRDFTPRVTVSDPVRTVWTGAYLNDNR
jgi:hypothetical protein